jgi:hypothetical protein
LWLSLAATVHQATDTDNTCKQAYIAWPSALYTDDELARVVMLFAKSLLILPFQRFSWLPEDWDVSCVASVLYKPIICVHYVSSLSPSSDPRAGP